MGAPPLDWARSRPLADGSYADLRQSYTAAQQSETDTDEQPGDPVAVLVVGGDQSQASSNSEVVAKVRQQDSNLSLHFIATNWSNWKQTLDDVQRLLPRFNAVVLSRLVRTTLGWHVRRLCSKHEVPWRFCYDAGQAIRIRAIMEAASAARDARER